MENHTDVVNLLLTYGAKIDVSAKVMNKLKGGTPVVRPSHDIVY